MIVMNDPRYISTPTRRAGGALARVMCSTARAVAGLLVCVLGSCSSEPAPLGEPVGVPDGCDPIVPERCGLPFPNDLWRGADGHLAFGANTLPTPRLGKPVAPSKFSWRDGFSPGAEATTYLVGATATGLPDEDHIADSILPSSRTILMDASTGELIPHFAELDFVTFADEPRALMIHPVRRLKDSTRYIAAIRRVVDASGNVITPSIAFRALRDRSVTHNAVLEGRRSHFEDIFGKLAAAGIDRSSLQLAWDYTTASRANTTGDLIAMRDDALAQVGALGPTYTIDNVEIAPNPHLAKRLHGRMTVPLYLNRPDPGDDERIFRGADGKPARNGTAQYGFVILVPNSATPAAPAAILQNGHGLLGGMNEGINGYFAEMCDLYDYVGIAVDWVGMAHEDNDTVINAMLYDIDIFQHVVDRQHQGVVNALLAMRMMIGRMKDDPNLQIGGKTILDPTHAYYRGDSQGGIFGTTYMSISTDVTRGLLGELGAPYNLLLDRSADFSGFKLLLKGAFGNTLDMRIVEGLFQLTWDRTEPDGYVPYLATDMFPNTPAHRVLMHVALGDHQVTPLGAHFIARTIGAKNFGPVNREVWGVPTVSGPLTDGSAMVEYDFGLPPAPLGNRPMTLGDDPHDSVRSLRPSMDQANEFFRNGDIKPFCDGPCNPN